MDKSTTGRNISIGQIRDLVQATVSYKDPFLHYLPQILERAELSHLNPAQVYQFALFAMRRDKPLLVEDGLRVLNQLVNENDGTLKNPNPSMFFNNHSFFWSRLGQNKGTDDVITHIINTVVFTLSLQN